MEFKQATRTGVKPLIAVYAESGNGKTMSALLLARGIVGPTGRIGMIDTEAGRGSLYADVIPGGYEVLNLDSPFSPGRCIEAIEALEAGGFDIGVLDSGSHFWEGIGGVLDMAGENEADGKKGLSVWKNPKMAHAKMMLKIMQSKLPLIICLRAKYKSRQVKSGGRTEIIKDDHVSPLQAEDFIFEMMAHAEILPNHCIRLSKCSHPSLRECFPADNTAPLSVKHGEAIAAWAAGGGAKPRPQSSARPADSQVGKDAVAPVVAGDPLKTAKKTLWSLVKNRFDDVPAFETYLLSEGKISDTETLAELPIDRITAITEFMRE